MGRSALKRKNTLAYYAISQMTKKTFCFLAYLVKPFFATSLRKSLRFCLTLRKYLRQLRRKSLMSSVPGVVLYFYNELCIVKS